VLSPTRTVTFGPSDRMPNALFTDLLLVTITPIGAPPVCTENLIRVVMESPKLAE
jgi:hypothetical protein